MLLSLFVVPLYSYLTIENLISKTKKLYKEKKNKQRQTKIQIKNLSAHNDNTEYIEMYKS